MIDQDLRGHLLADIEVSALLASNAIYPVQLPQKAALPAVIYSLWDDMPGQVTGGAASTKTQRVTLQIFAQSYAALRSLDSLILSKLDQYHGLIGSTQVVNIEARVAARDFEEDTQNFRSIMELAILSRS